LAVQGLGTEPRLGQYSGLIYDIQGWRLDLLFGATYALGYFALGGDGFLATWFSWDWIRWFGNISYSYYLVHGLVLHMLLTGFSAIRLPQTLSSPWFLLLAVFSFLATALGGAVLFLAVEKPFLALRKRKSKVEFAVSA
jgi:peptidoglycan/LPS O-acetylase OafA/YrhL